MSNAKANTGIIKDALRRFHHLPNLTIAKYIITKHPEAFEGNIEKVRSRIRYYRGANGKDHRGHLKTDEFMPTSPIKMPQTWRKIRTPYHLDPGLWLVLSDIHVPFHEPKPLEQAIKYGQAENVDGIFLNGDIQDCASISFWPTAKRDFDAEVELSIDFFDWLRSEFPKVKIVYKPGNHEYRLPRYFIKNAPEMAESPISAMEVTMGFEDREIEFLDYFQLVYAGLLPIIHGHEVQHISRTVNPARGLFLRSKTFSACSHCHSTSEHPEKTIEGKLLTTWSFGCLCDLQPEYNPFGNQWNWGFALINVEKDGDFEVTNKRILPSGDVR